MSLPKYKGIKETKFREHNIIVYPELSTFRNMYAEYAKEHLHDANDEILVLPSLPDKNGTSPVEVFPPVDPLERWTDMDNDILSRAKKHGKRGVCIIADMGSFFYFNGLDRLMNYEMSIPSVFADGIDLKSFCSYHADDFATLSESQKKLLLAHHHRSFT